MGRVTRPLRPLLGILVWFGMSHGPWPMAQDFVFASQRPSLFRGVVVADSPLGVRVVSIEESSQAFLADLRPEDIIVRVQDTQVRSIDEFAAVSTALKGQTISASVLIFRHGTPRELLVHLYSYPILRAWGLEFIPDHDIRFAQPEVGLEYWRRLGRGFEIAQDLPKALEAYLNGLHNVPTDVATAMKVSELSARISRRALQDARLAEGLRFLEQALRMTERLFDYSLSTEQLESVRTQLRETLQTLKTVTQARAQ